MMSGSESGRLAVAICGLGNIGSHLVPLLAREPAIGELGLIDRDTVSEANLAGQNFRCRDVGRTKVAVATGRAQQIAGERLALRAFHADLRNVPLGAYRRVGVVIGCLDSRRARADLAVKCWRAGRWFIDTGVNADAMLARVTVYAATADGPCYMCSIADWDSVEAAYTCDGGQINAPPTGAPAFLGAAAAVLAMNEVRRLLAGQLTVADSGREIVLELGNDHLYCSHHRRHPSCRFDHEILKIQGEVPSSMAIGDALALAPAGEGTSVGLRVEGCAFVRKLRCFASGCGTGSRTTLRLAGRLHASERNCPACGQVMQATGFDNVERLNGSELSAGMMRSSLRRLGFRREDVIGVGAPGAEAWFEIGDSDGRPHS